MTTTVQEAMKKILIVDTDPNTLTYLREKLDATNLAIRTACGGEEARRMLDYQKVDLMITALEMPRPHGMDLMVELTDRGWTIPVIFLSRLYLGESDVHKRLESCGPYVLLDRPISINQLRATVESLLKLRLRLTEKRLYTRVPRRMDVVMVFTNTRGEQSREPARTIDISAEGTCLERHVCADCTGYAKGGVHPDCLFAPYGERNERAGEHLEIIVKLSDHDVLVLKGQVMHTVIVEGTPREFLGVKFQGVTPDQRRELLRLIS